MVEQTVITYSYDPLYRLTRADYSDGRYFHYTYDAVGNRLSETKCPAWPCPSPTVTNYSYDSANRLTNVNGQTYQWDDNGNLLNDGTSTYTYDAANQLTSVTQGTTLSSYTYDGLGDRLSQTVDSVTTNYALDLNTGLTQVLADGTNTYLYGPSTGSGGRIGELQPAGFAYHLGDALGSVRQLTDGSGGVTLARSYEPYGETLTSAGSSNSVFQYTGEVRDASGLTFLRARYLSGNSGRFTSKDTWRDYTRPLTLNGWSYVEGDPINMRDPSGLCSECYVFFFPGAGNQGDIDDQFGGKRDNNLDDNLGEGEREMVRELRRRTGAIVIAVYPYGWGLRGNNVDKPLGTSPGIGEVDKNRNMRNAVLPAAYDRGDVPGYKADEIFAHVAGLDPYACSDQSAVKVDNDQLDITFIAYSGGGQMAYSTAQKLRGRLFVDNMVMFGAPFRAYGGMTNIGRLWNFRGEQDTFYGNIGQVALGWEDYNAGYRQVEGLPLYLQTPQDNIYQHGATRCTLLGTNDHSYGHGSYFDDSTAFTGVSCQGSYASEVSTRIGQVPLDWITEQGYASRFKANLNFLVDVVEGRLK